MGWTVQTPRLDGLTFVNINPNTDCHVFPSSVLFNGPQASVVSSEGLTNALS